MLDVSRSLLLHFFQTPTILVALESAQTKRSLIQNPKNNPSTDNNWTDILKRILEAEKWKILQ